MMPPFPYAESTCPDCGHRRPLTSRQYQAVFRQVWECPKCQGVFSVMTTTRCV